jgi:hypothetical protein
MSFTCGRFASTAIQVIIYLAKCPTAVSRIVDRVSGGLQMPVSCLGLGTASVAPMKSLSEETERSVHGKSGTQIRNS